VKTKRSNIILATSQQTRSAKVWRETCCGCARAPRPARTPSPPPHDGGVRSPPLGNHYRRPLPACHRRRTTAATTTPVDDG